MPDEALLRGCCWKKFRQVRGNRFHEIDDGAWNTLRGKHVPLTARQRPGG